MYRLHRRYRPKVLDKSTANDLKVLIGGTFPLNLIGQFEVTFWNFLVDSAAKD
jgi:hypothetical protein